MAKIDGVVFSGGTQTVGQVVAGTNARAEMHIGATDRDLRVEQEDLSLKLDLLIRLLRDNQTILPDGANLIGDASRVAAELAKPTPSKTKISSLLQMLEDGTKDIASIASVVSSVKAIAGGLLGLF